MTLELLHVIRDYNIHLQGHQYQNHARHIKDTKYLYRVWSDRYRCYIQHHYQLLHCTTSIYNHL